MDVIPVIDIMGGVAVAGQRGERERYHPLQSIYSRTSDPIAIANALPYEKLYVADLDGIIQRRPDYSLLWELSLTKKTMVDAGIVSFEDVKKLAHMRCDVILGTETLGGLEVLRKSIATYGDRILVSLDMKNSRVLSTFLPSSPLDVVRILKEEGVRRLIFLDISSVGTLEGGSYEIIELLVKNFPCIEFTVGGGIRPEDLEKMEKIGIEAVLVGTALHRGMLRR
jgi:phosphoribosylformimino-5-aminoimidazole carboxamide ribotide isomerase